MISFYFCSPEEFNFRTTSIYCNFDQLSIFNIKMDLNLWTYRSQFASNKLSYMNFNISMNHLIKEDIHCPCNTGLTNDIFGSDLNQSRKIHHNRLMTYNLLPYNDII